MSTNKLRIQAYVQSELYQQFEQERSQWDVSQSQALERILLERYQHDSGEQAISTRESVHWIALVEDLRKRVERLESNLPSELDSSLPSELESVTSELDSELSDNLPSESTTSLPSESPKLVVCKLYKNNPNDPQSWRYWAGDKAGFVEDLNKAKTYTDKGSSRVINRLLEDDLHKPTSRERISCRSLEELTAMVAKAENSEPMEITSEVPSQLVEQTLDYRLVVYKFDKGKPYRPEYWHYWADSKAGFVKDLTTATLYTSEMSAEQMIAQLLGDEIYKPTATERIRWTVLEYLIKLGANYESDC
ncbi:hypothetical protein [Aliterella atlantica]|uniref:Uncharacterized protein n=1 Tax=Aliterella atlantica CENA595 TaxID=1618023 RepID=A0A0D8ZL07_9CYAN|nr:hypothetical protein [Aliterella atlantica]KJH69415.1 hypothetical protein UH38_24060 [Aliterella atlantica CENA595]